MPHITFKPSGIIVDVPADSSLLDAAKKAGISVEIPCGGNGLCGKCLVKIEYGSISFNNNGVLSQSMLDENLVLLCKTKVLDEPVCVHLFSDLVKEKGKFSPTSDDMRFIESDLLPSLTDIEPIVKRAAIEVASPVMGDGLADFDRLKKAVLSKLGGQDIELPLNLLKVLPYILRETDGKINLFFYRNENDVHIVNIEQNNFNDKFYGIAVDIGTTTIAIQLVSMTNGIIIASKTDYNAQIECGLDVISRINYAKKREKLEELRIKVTGTINRILKELIISEGIHSNDIYNASVAGNTTMVHLLLGIIPEFIRLEPYTPAIYQVPFYKASEIGIDINPYAPVYLAPSVGSYVGGDITSGVLCTRLAAQSEELCLFIDIGTNGEIILGNNDFLLGCACSAGPAFEGGGIEHGMRASQGAIERVDIDKETGIAVCSTIGNTAPAGVCGSGIISLIAGLFKAGWIDAAGKLERLKPCSAIEINGKNAKYILAAAEKSKNGKTIYITEADIDNLIRAKGAIFSACRVMLQSIDMDFEDVSRIYIAGGFGRYLDIEKSTIIGLLPDLPSEKFTFIGNSSIIGAYMTLLSLKHREKQLELSKKITYIDLSTEPRYMDQYTAALFLPHTDSKLFKRFSQ